MHVVLNLVWQVIIDDMLDVGEVQTLAGHISRYQNILVPTLQTSRCDFATQ